MWVGVCAAFEDYSTEWSILDPSILRPLKSSASFACKQLSFLAHPTLSKKNVSNRPKRVPSGTIPNEFHVMPFLFCRHDSFCSVCFLYLVVGGSSMNLTPGLISISPKGSIWFNSTKFSVFSAKSSKKTPAAVRRVTP